MTAQPTGSGLLKDFARVDATDAADLVGRLDMMHSIEFFKRYKRDTFELMNVGPGARVADVACGTGEDARIIADLLGEQGQVVGFDVSQSMIEEARRRHADAGGHVRFEQASADRLPVDDASFDAVRTDRLYVHLTEPEAALREAVRVVRPGGSIVVSEPDMASFWSATDHLAISWKIARGVAASVDNPGLTRRLVSLFRDAGLEDLQLRVDVFVSEDPRPAERLLNIRAIVEGLVATGDLTAEEARLWAAEYERQTADGRFLAGLSFFIVAGRRPI